MTADAPNPQAAIERLAARVFLVDRDGSVLLLRGRDPNRPEAGWWWLTPGGGIDEGESAEDAARREVREETGLVISGELGEVVLRRDVQFDFEGLRYDQREQFFCVRCDRFTIDDTGWTDVERRSMAEHRWWTYEELVATDETIYPEQLAAVLKKIVDVS